MVLAIVPASQEWTRSRLAQVQDSQGTVNGRAAINTLAALYAMYVSA